MKNSARKGVEVRCHELKTLREYFRAIKNRTKKAELRKTDRDFMIGDFMLLKEWVGEQFTGDWVLARITHILDGSHYVHEGYALLSFEVIAERTQRGSI